MLRCKQGRDKEYKLKNIIDFGIVKYCIQYFVELKERLLADKTFGVAHSKELVFTQKLFHPGDTRTKYFY